MLRVAVLGFEPAVQGSLEQLLSREQDLFLVKLPLQAAEEGPDVVLIEPPNPDWVAQLHAQFPAALLVAIMDWHRQDLFRSSPIDSYVERFQSYPSLVELLRQKGEAKERFSA